MSVEMRSIRCHHFRVTGEPCMNPAVVEVLGPTYNLLCADHAAAELEAGPGYAHREGWEVDDPETYARHCEHAVDLLDESPFHDNPVLSVIMEEALNYLELYEMQRARAVLERRGGRREETSRERKFREFYEQFLARGGDSLLS